MCSRERRLRRKHSSTLKEVNTTEQELADGRGIGPERARRIVQSRPFRSWEDVKKVEGFIHTLVDDLRQAGATLGGEARRAD